MNPTTTKYKMKKLYILLAVLSELACVGLALSRLLVNYATVSTVSQAAGPEHAPAYTALAVVCLVLTVAALACREKAKMQSTNKAAQSAKSVPVSRFFPVFIFLPPFKIQKWGQNRQERHPVSVSKISSYSFPTLLTVRSHSV